MYQQKREMKIKHKITAVLLCLVTLFSGGVTAFADSSGVTYTAAQVQSLCDGILAFKRSQGGAYDNQSLIDGYLSDNAGSLSEFYIIGLSQYGSYSFKNYERALLSYIGSHNVTSASTREKYALALAASGSTDSYITDTADDAIGGLGLMSLIFGLHILNNGYQSSSYSADSLAGEILSYQLSDGGWAVIGSYGDVDVTAMALQALAPHTGRSDVRYAVDRALSLLSSKQLDSGGFKSMGSENCESAAQVVTALSALGIDAQYDSRFVKSGGSALSAMLSYRNSDGSFAHIGSGYNESATVQAFYAMVAFVRYCRGQSSLYILDNAEGYTVPEKQESRGSSSSGSSSSGGSSGNNSSGNASGGNNSSGSGSNGANNKTDSSGKSSTGGKTASGTENKSATSASQGAKTPTHTLNAAESSDNQSERVKPSYGRSRLSATEDSMSATADTAGKSGPGYKLYAVIGILIAAGLVCLLLFILKKRNKKNYIAVGIIAAVGIVIILITNFETVESHSSTDDTDGEFTVTMSISCDTIKDREKVNSYIPDDGVILDKTEFKASEGDTVYDILMLANKKYGIPIDNTGAQGAAYIAGINYLYEFDYGDLSGWMYRVNGVLPEVGCQSYTVSDGDEIEWLYTTNIGKDF